MLGIMRKYQQSAIIKIVFAVIVLSFIGTIFLVWGRGERTSEGKLAYAAKVNGTKISLDDFSKAYNRLRNIYEQIYNRTMTPEQEKQLGIRKMALGNLVDEVLMRGAAKEMGIEVKKEDVAAQIAKNASFQKNGVFDFKLYQMVLRENRLTPQEYEDAVRGDLLIEKARQKIKDAAKVTDDEVLKAYHKEHDKVDVAFVSYSPADVRKEVKLSDQDLNVYLQAHADQFKTPERISLAWLAVEPARHEEKVTVSDAEAQDYYQRHIDAYQGGGGILPFAQVKEKVIHDARLAKAASDAYGAAAEALNKNAQTGNLNAAAATLGVKVLTTPLFTATAPPAPFKGNAELIRRAFTTREGELGGPVETPTGIYLFKVVKREPAAVPPLAQVRSEVESRAVAEKAKDLAFKKASDALALLAKGGTGVKTEETGPFGWSAKGDIPRVGASPAIMDAAFNLTNTAPTPLAPIVVGNRVYAFRLKNRTVADNADFEKTKEAIRQQLIPQKQQEAVAAWLKGLKAKAKIELNTSLLTD